MLRLHRCYGKFRHVLYFASYQLAPDFASASSGTFSCTTFSISAVTIFLTCSASLTGHSTISSSCTCQNEPRLELLPSERRVDANHGQLDDIRRRTLNGGVERNALTERADIEVAAFDAPAAHGRRPKTWSHSLPLRLLDNFMHIGPDACIMRQVIVDILPRFLVRDADVLRRGRTPKCRIRYRN